MLTDPHPVPELPASSAALVLVRVGIESYIATAHLPRRMRAKAFIDVMAHALENGANLAKVSPIRASTGHDEAAQADVEAYAMFRALRTTFLARLPRGDT